MTSGYDALVLGAGHNGLVAALTLAAQGGRVLVLERSETIGGLCAAIPFAPGYRAAGLLPDTAGFRAELSEALDLESFGLAFHDVEPTVWVPTPEGDLRLPVASTRGDASGDALGTGDRRAFAAWSDLLTAATPFVKRLLDAPPPRLEIASAGDLRAAAATGWALRKLGRRTTVEILRVLPMCAADWLREWFEPETLAAALAAPALLGSFNGPWAAGSAASLLFREATAGRSVRGGPPALIAALERAATTRGVEIRTASGVERIEVESGAVRGVSLAGGDSIASESVIATCSPRTTLLELVEPRHLDATTEREMLNYRSRGVVAVLLLAVEGTIDGIDERPGPGGRLRLGTESLDRLERAFDAAKYDQVSERPYLEVWIPSLETPELAPPGGHVIAALIHCVPRRPEGGWSGARREALVEACVRRIDEHLPGLRDRLAGGRLLAPGDLEEALALPGGHLTHGESALDQLLFLRPGLHLSRYATPIRGLYLGGSGSHPGGGVTGMPGRLAAGAVSSAG